MTQRLPSPGARDSLHISIEVWSREPARNNKPRRRDGGRGLQWENGPVPASWKRMSSSPPDFERRWPLTTRTYAFFTRLNGCPL